MPELTSKQLVKGLFQLKDLPRPPFVPWVCSFAAQLEQVRVDEMLSDSGLLSTSLANAQKLFGYDAICNVFDPTLEAEALGCDLEWGGDGDPPVVASHPLHDGAGPEALNISGLEKSGRIPVVIEATKRLKIVMGKDVAIVGVVTGPLTLAGHLKGEKLMEELDRDPAAAGRAIALAGNVCLSLARKYCELGVDAIAIADDTLGKLRPQDIGVAAGPLKSIWNVLKFYNVNSLLLTRGCTDQHVLPLLGLGADGVALSGDLDHAHLREAALGEKRCYAGTIPVSATTGGATGDCLPQRGRGFFLSTDWEVPYVANVEAMHDLMRAVRDGP